MKNNLKDSLEKEFKRRMWRLQYYERKSSGKIFVKYENMIQEPVDIKVIEELNIEYILDLIPRERARNIIYSIYIQEKSIKEISVELNISVQAVNKCRRKTLEFLKMKI